MGMEPGHTQMCRSFFTPGKFVNLTHIFDLHKYSTDPPIEGN